jgi:hypothetical protein
MKISDLNSAGLNGLTTGSVNSSQGIGAYGRAGRGAYGPAPDQVHLSGASRLASSALVAHASRLSELKSLVAAGEYNPSADEIGKSMLGEALSRTS